MEGLMRTVLNVTVEMVRPDVSKSWRELAEAGVQLWEENYELKKRKWLTSFCQGLGLLKTIDITWWTVILQLLVDPRKMPCLGNSDFVQLVWRGPQVHNVYDLVILEMFSCFGRVVAVNMYNKICVGANRPDRRSNNPYNPIKLLWVTNTDISFLVLGSLLITYNSGWQSHRLGKWANTSDICVC